MAKYETPAADPLAQQWKKRITDAKKHWDKFHKRVAHNRKTVAGFDWKSDPTAAGFYKLRANLIQGTITATLPQIYAKNPEVSVSPNYNADSLKLFCHTLEKVTNLCLEKADLKTRAKSTVRAALTCSFGIVKVMYQRDIQEDPAIIRRIEDAQDNIAHADQLLAEIEDDSQRGDIDALKAELQQTIEGLKAQTEIVMGEGLVIDRLLTEHLLIDPIITEFWDYAEAGWMSQIIPMRKSQAEATYKINLDKATPYKTLGSSMTRKGGLASADSQTTDDDEQVSIIEIWDKTTQRVYTMCDGCDYWVREPYSPPRAGQRWYPYFLLPFQTVDGQFVGPSLVDLTERLQDEHNDARNKFNRHRDLIKPGWIAAGQIDQKSIKRYADSEIGEITIVDTQGAPLAQFIQPRQHPPVDPAAYDTSAVRYDWEQVTGMQDAARSSVVNPKTATESQIMNEALAGRVGEFRDQVEDWLQEIARHAAQILIFELKPEQVEKIMGPHEMGEMIDPVSGQAIEVPVEMSYDWPQLTRDEIFDMISLKIRAGTTGSPDKQQQRESWGEMMPVIQGLIGQIMELQVNGMDAEPMINLLKETINRFDDKLTIDDFLPKPPKMPQMPVDPAQQQTPVDPSQAQQGVTNAIA